MKLRKSLCLLSLIVLFGCATRRDQQLADQQRHAASQKTATTQSSPDADYKLALRYATGDGVPKNERRAAELY